MELMGIADEASPSIDGQIRATKELGWKWIEARFAEVNGFEKGPVHDIPDEAFDIMAGLLEAAGGGVDGGPGFSSHEFRSKLDIE